MISAGRDEKSGNAIVPSVESVNGFISKVSPDGSVLDLTWIQSGVQGVRLNGRKGLALSGEARYVADVDTLRVFDRRTGAIRRKVAPPNPFAPKPLFLNDVVVGGDGTAYLTDNRNSAIFVVDRRDRASVLVSGPQLGGPNRILFDRGSLSWVTVWASDQAAHAFGTASHRGDAACRGRFGVGTIPLIQTGQRISGSIGIGSRTACPRW